MVRSVSATVRKRRPLTTALFWTAISAIAGGTVKTTWKYSGGQQVRPAPLEPRGAGQGLTARTVAVAAGVVPDAPMAAVATLLDVAAEGGGATLLDGRHHAALRRREGGPDLGSEVVAVAAEDLRYGERGAWHGRSSVDGLGALWYGPREVQRTLGRADRAGGDLQIPRRRLQTPMPEQELNRAQVGAGLEEMNSKRVTECVWGNPLGKAARVGPRLGRRGGRRRK